MIDIYMTNPSNGALSEQEKILPGTWVHLCDPTPEEIGRVSSAQLFFINGDHCASSSP